MRKGSSSGREDGQGPEVSTSASFQQILLFQPYPQDPRFSLSHLCSPTGRTHSIF